MGSGRSAETGPRRPDGTLKEKHVAFASHSIKERYQSLSKGKSEGISLWRHITRAIDHLAKDPTSGVKIPAALWPPRYVTEHGITNLWKYNLPKARRLVYTIKQDEVMIISVILEWFDHKEYERRFNY